MHEALKIVCYKYYYIYLFIYDILKYIQHKLFHYCSNVYYVFLEFNLIFCLILLAVER